LAIVDRVHVPGQPKSATVVRFRISNAGKRALRDGEPSRRAIAVTLALLALFVIGVFAGIYVWPSLIPHA
jgi:hypothetical protein